MDGTGAALGDTATIFGSGQTELLAQDPQQRCRRIGLEIESTAIDIQCRHGGLTEKSLNLKTVAGIRKV
jgi:hypothetical protein